MTPIRIFKDKLLQGITLISSTVTLLILTFILAFIVQQGKGVLNLEMLRNNYWSQNYLVEWSDSQSGDFERPHDLEETVIFSSRFGIGFQDEINHEKKRLIRVAYIDSNSPFITSINATNGDGYGEFLSVNIGDNIEKLETRNNDGEIVLMGTVFSDNAQTLVDKLEQSEQLNSLYYKTVGGGIWGSLLATLMLIGLSLLFSLPLGIFAAIYLTEIASPSILTTFIERCIEMLAGVPSIVFGLMGMVVLFPITAIFKVTGLSVLLGSLTMAVVLLPVIIRSVQESLLVVPKDYRLASLSLGASQTQTIFKVVLPSALPGILSAIILATGRIIGESAALIYTMGTFINDTPSITKGGTSLAIHIWSVMSQEQPNFQLASAISLIILLIVLSLNLGVKGLTRHLNNKLGG